MSPAVTVMMTMALMMTIALVTMMMTSENFERFAEGGRHLGFALMSSAAGRP